jgi:hypothetical protein
MSETAAPALAPAEVSVPEVMTPAAPVDRAPDRLNPSEAGRILSEYRRNKQSQAAAPEAAPAQDSAQADAAAPVEPPGDETPPADPAEETLPSIEPPRSWTKESKEAFAALPREHQELIAEQERAREVDLRRGHNEVAEKLKTADAEAKAMAEARSKYEAALPQLLNHLTADPQWADIKTMADVERLAQEDWPRAVQWQIHQQKVQAVHAEIQQAQQRQQSEQSQKWADFAKREDQSFLEKAPELKDSGKAAKMREAAVNMLKATGYSEDELGKLWESPALRDHRMQLLIYKAAQFDEAKKNVLNAVKKPLPPVNRPGVATQAKSGKELADDLLAKVDRSSGLNAIRAGHAALMARRQSR